MKRQRHLTEDHGKIIFVSVCARFFFSVMYPTFKHAPWKESTNKRSVDDLELFDDQRRKSARIIWFLSSPWSGFRRLSTACKSDDLSSNYKRYLAFAGFFRYDELLWIMQYRSQALPYFKSTNSSLLGKCALWNFDGKCLPFTSIAQLFYDYWRTLFVGLKGQTNPSKHLWI